MNINTEWNEEPPGQAPNWMGAIQAGFNWLGNQARPAMQQMLQQIPQQTPEQNVEDMIRQLRQERARQSYERNFGMSYGNNRSMMSQGQGGQAEAMRQMVRNWNQSGRNNR
jgi:hypothetical protein